jgi:hypothetical protein
MRSTTASGETTNGVVPSSQAQDCAPAEAVMKVNMKKRKDLKRVRFRFAPR